MGNVAMDRKRKDLMEILEIGWGKSKVNKERERERERERDWRCYTKPVKKDKKNRKDLIEILYIGRGESKVNREKDIIKAQQ